VAPDEGVRTDTTKETVGDEVGVDGGAAGAEEAAVHVVEDDTVLPDSPDYPGYLQERERRPGQTG
jgi:hypothetical protein